MMPGNVLSTMPVQAAFIEASPNTPLVDVELGGVGIGNPGEGLDVQLWTLRYVDGEARLRGEGVDEVVLFSRGGITNVSLAFDQNMNPFVAFTDAGGTAFWWYDSQVGQAVFSAYLPAGSVNPRCTLDDKRALSAASSDIILAYLRGRSLYMRQQRDRFGIEYLLHPDAGTQLVALGMNRARRLQFRLTK